MNSTSVNVGLMGLGVVGGGVAAALLQDPSPVAARVGLPVNLRRVLVRDRSRHRDVELPPGMLTTNAEDILDDPEIDILVEVMGGSDPAAGYFRRALSSGKHVVTANKEVMAKEGADLMALARANRVSLLFEASVGGGIPIVGCLMNELAANDVHSIRTIINGTTNYILTRMAHERTAFADALSEAQGLGYAEADPTNDVEGIDAAYKLTVLATLAYGCRFGPDDVFRQGISALEPQDFRYAEEFGYSIKSLAIADQNGDEVQLRVYPALVPFDNMLANVNGVYNAVEVHGSLCGQVLFHGMGAGRGSDHQRGTGGLGRDCAPRPGQRRPRRPSGAVPSAGRAPHRCAADAILHPADSCRPRRSAGPDRCGIGRRGYQHRLGVAEGRRCGNPERGDRDNDPPGAGVLGTAGPSDDRAARPRAPGRQYAAD